MPFTIQLNSSSGVPFYRQIINQIIVGIAHGILAPGTRLPTVRQLAVDLAINLNTVARAYKELEIRGIVSTQQGSGTFINGIPDELAPDEREAQLRQSCEHFLTELAARGITLEEGILALKKFGGTPPAAAPGKE